MKKSLNIFILIIACFTLEAKGQDAFGLYADAINRMIYSNISYTYTIRLDCWNDAKTAKEKVISTGEFIRTGDRFYYTSKGLTTVYDGTYMLNISDKAKTIMLEKFEDFIGPDMITAFIDSNKMEVASEIKVTADSTFNLSFKPKNRTEHPTVVASAQVTIDKNRLIKKVYLVFDKEKADKYSRPCENLTITYSYTGNVGGNMKKLELKNYVHIEGDKASGVGKYKEYEIVSTLNLTGYESK